jgi:hypothetical protein
VVARGVADHVGVSGRARPKKDFARENIRAIRETQRKRRESAEVAVREVSAKPAPFKMKRFVESAHSKVRGMVRETGPARVPALHAFECADGSLGP